MILAFKLMSIVNILLFFIILCATISIHELGHLLFAKKFNVYCYEYSIGFGKAIYTNKKGETHFCIRIIPLGGFVKMAGEEGLEEGEELLDNNEQPIPKERIFGNAKKGPKILILAAGGLFNMILAYLCFFIFLMGYGVVNTSEPIIGIVENGALANQTEISNQVYITKVEVLLDGNQIVEVIPNNFNDIGNAILKAKPIAEGQERTIRFTYKENKKSKNEKEATLVMVSKMQEKDDGETIYYFDKIGYQATMKKYGFFQAIPKTFAFMGEYFVEMCKAFGQLFTGKFENLSGLVGIYEAVDQASSIGGVTPIIYIAGAISFSLGFFNLIPFPALDGGRIFFVLVETVTRKKVNPKVEGLVHSIGFILLFGLMIIINIKDIIGLF